MKKIILFLTAMLMAIQFVSGQVSVNGLFCENLQNPIGLEVKQPRFSWRIHAEKGQRNVMQTAYEIRVAADEKDLVRGKNLIWNSGKVTSN